MQALPEVEVAEGGLFAFEKTYAIDASGEIVRPLGPPVFTTSWDGPSAVSSFRNIEGGPPSGQEVVLDATQAEAGGFALGDAITISLPTGQPEIFTLAGTLDFGEGGTGGASGADCCLVRYFGAPEKGAQGDAVPSAIELAAE